MLLISLFQPNAQSNTSRAAVQLLKLLKAPVTRSTIIDMVESHPDYPSLFSISDSLRKWKVENMAVEIEAANLTEVPTPFIAFFGDGFVVIQKIESNTVTYLTNAGKEKTIRKGDFLKQWNKVVLYAEAAQNSGEENFAVNRRKEWLNNARIPIIVSSCFAFVVLLSLIAQQETWASTSFILFANLKLIGCIITGLLLWYDIDNANPILQQICGGGKEINCNAILSSKGAKLFSWLNWSEVGFFYFAGGFLFLLMSGINPQPALGLLSWLNVLALPYVLFSVLYQWRVAKQWCPFCLAVQAILIVEFIVSYFSYWSLSTNQPLLLSTFFSTLFCFSLPVFFWVFTKTVLLNAQQADRYKKELSRLKYNPQIFDALLVKQKQVTVSTEGLGLILGNPKAANTIIKVCNPYCGPCAKAHPVLESLLENNADIKVQVIFTATNDENDNRSKPVKHLMALYEKDSTTINSALSDWYGADKKEYVAFACKYKLNGELERQGEKLEAMSNWCIEMKIEYTPTFFIKGYQLPEVYKVEDLKRILV